MNKVSKIIWSIFSSAICLMYRNDANAHSIPSSPQCTLYSGTSICGNGSDTAFHEDSDFGCKTKGTIKCFHSIAGHNFSAINCTECLPGYTFTQGGVVTDTSCITGITGSKIGFYKYTCECKCSNCTDTGTWTAKGTGYEQRTGKGCDCSSGTAQCITSTYYRCAAGYYGTTSNGTSGCNKCPDQGTSPADSTTVSDCYIPKGTYSDTTGKYALECNCPYNGKDSCDSGGSSSSSA